MRRVSPEKALWQTQKASWPSSQRETGLAQGQAEYVSRWPVCVHRALKGFQIQEDRFEEGMEVINNYQAPYIFSVFYRQPLLCPSVIRTIFVNILINK